MLRRGSSQVHLLALQRAGTVPAPSNVRVGINRHSGDNPSFRGFIRVMPGDLCSTAVAKMLNSIALRRSLSQLVKTDNGSEFAGKMLDKWVYLRGIRIDLSRPGTPTDNATVASFNGRLRQECQNENWFMSLEDAR